MTKLVDNNGKALGSAPLNATSHTQATAAMRQLEVIDPETVTPLEYRVLVKVSSTEDVTDGGIFKPESFFEKEMFNKTEATFVSCGDEAFTGGNGEYIESRPEKGDKIITAKYPGNPYRDEAYNLYRFCNDKDVIAIIKGDK